MRFLHTMVRARDLDETLDFYCNKLGLVEVRRYDSEAGRFTLVFLAAPNDAARAEDETWMRLLLLSSSSSITTKMGMATVVWRNALTACGSWTRTLVSRTYAVPGLAWSWLGLTRRG